MAPFLLFKVYKTSLKVIFYFSISRVLITASLDFYIVSILYPPSSATITLLHNCFNPYVIHAYPTGVTPIPPIQSLIPESKPLEIITNSGLNSFRIGNKTFEQA